MIYQPNSLWEPVVKRDTYDFRPSTTRSSVKSYVSLVAGPGVLS
jgi:hypothetical protein